MMRSSRLLTLILNILCVTANTEKTIFTAPEPVPIPQDAALENLLLMRLHPANLSLRTHLNASFPTKDKPHGDESWFLLEGLSLNQRYEVRVCWLATQPTSFWLDTYSMSHAFETPELISSLSAYSHSQRATLTKVQIKDLLANRYKPEPGTSDTSMLFLRIQAAADYFTLNRTLMENVPPVHVDLILDPYLFNIFPQSLLATARYIAAIATFAFLLSGIVYHQLNEMAAGGKQATASANTKKVN